MLGPIQVVVCILTHLFLTTTPRGLRIKSGQSFNKVTTVLYRTFLTYDGVMSC